MGVRREERITMSVGSLVRIEARPRRIGLAILREGGEVVVLLEFGEICLFGLVVP